MPRRIGSALGRQALKTTTKMLPETVLVPVDPMSVTLISRPDTPRFRKSNAVIVPTFVRES